MALSDGEASSASAATGRMAATASAATSALSFICLFLLSVYSVVNQQTSVIGVTRVETVRILLARRKIPQTRRFSSRAASRVSGNEIRKNSSITKPKIWKALISPRPIGGIAVIRSF